MAVHGATPRLENAFLIEQKTLSRDRFLWAILSLGDFNMAANLVVLFQDLWWRHTASD